MSLLLDALKRAELEKMARGDSTAPSNDPQASAAHQPAVAPGKSALELQPLHSPAAAPAPAPSAAGSAKTDAQAAQVAFAAKAPSHDRSSRKGWLLWAVVGAIALVVIGGAGYVWYAMQGTRTQVTARPRPIAQSPAQPPASAAPAAEAAATTQPVTTPSAASARGSPETSVRGAQPVVDPEALMAKLLRDTTIPANAAPKLTPTPATTQVPADVAAGYGELRKGDLAAARRSYATALTSDPSNLDALLGMATVEALAGNRTAAAAHYRKVLTIDAANGTAIAGLAALVDFANPQAVESQLRLDLARNPESAALNFTLGNLYASQSRWNEAQARFFDAHRLDPSNPDMAFNLAVSLDHLGQSRAAGDFYARAIEAAKSFAPQFDPAAARRRMAELQP